MTQHIWDTKGDTTNFSVVIDTADKYGYFEHHHQGDDYAGGLWFDDQRELIDYDGVFELPAEVCNFLKEKGFKVADEFYPDDTEPMNAMRSPA